MKLSKTIIITLVLVIGATSAFAQLAGVWEGTGTGNAYPYPGVVIYPWQTWKGEIPLTQDVFTGEWYDDLGNHGIFKGVVEFSSIPEIAYAKGAWYWYDPTGPANQPVYGGKFEMTFWFLEERCEGTWNSIWPSPGPPGTMTGWKVSPD